MTNTESDTACAIRLSMELYLKNKRKEAFKTLVGESGEETRILNPDSRDAQSIRVSVKAMIELIEGLLSGSAETIMRCLEDFWVAERLANESDDKEWIGNRISRGLSYLFGGLVQLFIGSYVKAGVNLTIGYKLVRAFERDVLVYNDENDSDLIRSLGLLVLALLNFFAIMLPPSVVTMGEMLGFGPSRAKFNEYISLCSDEKGIFSYIAKLIEVYSVINSKNFMFAKISNEEISRCRMLMDECLVDAPESIVVRVMNASVFLGEGRREEAIETLRSPEIIEVIGTSEWSTMSLAVSYKLGVAYLCAFEFDKASEAFSKAADSIDASNRWHYVPFMRCLEGLSLLASAAQDPERFPDMAKLQDRVIKIFDHCFIERNLSNTVVLPGDYWGARVGLESSNFLMACDDERFSDWIRTRAPITDILFAILTCLYQFDKVSLNDLRSFIKSTKSTNGSARLEVVRGEYYRRIERFTDSVAAFDEALVLTDAQVGSGKADKDSITAFSLVFQGAALCLAGEKETAREVLSDLDQERARSKSLWSPLAPKVSNLVKTEGGEFDLILSFRRNGLKRLIDES